MLSKKGYYKFYIGDNENQTLAEVLYVEMGKINVLLKDTFVSEDHHNLGEILIEEVVEYAKKEKKRIVARCPYAKDIIIKKQYNDILAP